MIELYECDKCGWIGKEPKELAGYLWDYTMHDACPVCWENDAEDRMVSISYYAYIPGEIKAEVLAKRYKDFLTNNNLPLETGGELQEAIMLYLHNNNNK